MTQEEIAKVKAMTREQRLAHFVPLRLNKRISKEQYDFILGTPYEVVRVEAHALPQAKEALVQGRENPIRDVLHPRETLSPPQEDWVLALARQFGGTVLSDTPTGKQGRLDEKSEQIKRNMMSG
jgi:hypothetical protein